MWKYRKFLVGQLANLSINNLANQYVDIQQISQPVSESVKLLACLYGGKQPIV
jgi:hypothetical protein